MSSYKVICGDCREIMRGMPEASIECCVTSPPYWGLRDYGVEGQIGLEPSPDAYVAKMVEVFREVRRVLRDDGTLWLNLGDSYATFAGKVGKCPGGGTQGENWKGATTSPNRMPIAGLKPKDLIGIPWRVAFALQADGWWLRQDIIWAKPNPMPESVTDRCTKSHEYIFLLSKSERYYYDHEAASEPALHAASGNKQRKPATERGAPHDGVDGNVPWSGTTRNRRSVWTVATKPYSEAHFATFPPQLIEPCVLAGCQAGGTIIDPFTGSGTTGEVAIKHGRDFIGCELNPEYVEMANRRIRKSEGLFT